MNIVITMAGIGSRFRKAGFDCPKYMIAPKGKTLFEWSMDSLLDYNSHVRRYCFMVRKEDAASAFIKDKASAYGIKDIDIIELDYLTDGQATTALFGVKTLPVNEPVMIYNIDTYIEPYSLKYTDISGDGYIPCFKAEGDHWSFVCVDEGGKVAEVREKDRISDNCSIGAYYFSSAELYRRTYEEFYVRDGLKTKNEKYIAPMYNYMIDKGYEVTMNLLPAEKVHVLGTPEELQGFIET